MRRDSASLLVALLFGGLLSSAWGQIARQPTPVKLGITAPGCSQQSHRFQAYTAESKTTSVQTLANGTTITRESTEVRAVDSELRTLDTRTESPFPAEGGDRGVAPGDVPRLTDSLARKLFGEGCSLGRTQGLRSGCGSQLCGGKPCKFAQFRFWLCLPFRRR
jgi:hypothetical protein